jgi:hypothetical protein
MSLHPSQTKHGHQQRAAKDQQQLRSTWFRARVYFYHNVE